MPVTQEELQNKQACGCIMRKSRFAKTKIEGMTAKHCRSWWCWASSVSAAYGCVAMEMKAGLIMTVKARRPISHSLSVYMNVMS